MSNSDFDDEFDETADPVDEEPDTGDEPAEAPAEGAAPASDGALSDVAEAESLTVSSKEALRRQLEEEMERFLSRGGKIVEVPADETSDPPRKPVSSYGSKPI
ncbi:hypothetical protein EV700_1437 [Fluviicoccus keumensis]|uniref:Transcriptional regulator SutA RNAP-binding domain-containing protein n=1 Tax=Fluviicoccus keumensis TaxID=1435465 RepID=A0A4Q7Z938_9GAMM|nr:hypothetical protein [Fluviicoccus keumensis]RZU47047.1 hypothetical protein EV700_1437 [Fluviicoccus keumensis]